MGKVINIFAPIAQLVEQIPLKDTVAGSNPAGRTILKKGPKAFFKIARRSEARQAVSRKAKGVVESRKSADGKFSLTQDE